MKTYPLIRQCALLVALAWITTPGQSIAAGDSQATKAPYRDGQHDFDFNFGTWQTHIKNILAPLSGSQEFVEMNGTVTVRPIWGGRAQLEEIEAEGPKGHWEGLTVFLYNPQAHQWSQSFVDSKSGVLTPGMVGSFSDGRGELYVQDTLDGRTVLVRGVWSEIKPNSHHFEQDYSDDGGATWHPAFVAELTRLKP